ncbi:hypothetical protein P886_3336 [Alteromonadaceae bacterium 2753L.S.0a.02]|nr:hypothetical protein P886_3336 [Alteromonadaceae bacterium 2753L.S.0a.02]
MRKVFSLKQRDFSLGENNWIEKGNITSVFCFEQLDWSLPSGYITFCFWVTFAKLHVLDEREQVAFAP